MSEESVEIVRRMYEAWDSADPGSALAFFTEDVVWTPAREDPDPRPHRGREGVRQFWAQWAELFDDIRIEPEEVQQHSECVVGRLHVTGTGKGSGVDIDQRVYQVLRLRGNQVARVDEFYDRGEALEAAGLRE